MEEVQRVTMSGVDFNGKAYGLAYLLRKTDAGRSLSKRPRQSNDCTVRAYAIALKLPYDQAYDTLKAAGRKSGRGFKFSTWINRHVGVEKLSFPAKKGEKRMSVAVFCETHPEGTYVCNVAKHVFAVIDGIVLDTVASNPDRCVYTAWKIS